AILMAALKKIEAKQVFSVITIAPQPLSAKKRWETIVFVCNTESHKKNTHKHLSPRVLAAVKEQARAYLVGLAQDWQEAPKDLIPKAHHLLFNSQPAVVNAQVYEHLNPDEYANYAYTILKTLLAARKKESGADVLYPSSKKLGKEKIYLLCTKKEL